MANVTYEQHVKDLIVWLLATAKSMSTDPATRKWCVLQLKDLSPDTIKEYFDRSDLNDQFNKEYQLGVLTNTPVAFLQLDSDSLYSLQKAYMTRHHSRLRSYRDDCEQKDIRVHNSVSLGLAKLRHMKSLT